MEQTKPNIPMDLPSLLYYAGRGKGSILQLLETVKISFDVVSACYRKFSFSIMAIHR